jgi:hypothetical protein
MGFRMTSARLNTWLLHGLHFTLAISIPLFLVLILGCKKIKEDPPRTNYGPQTTVDEIVDAISRARQDASFDGMQAGHYVDFVINRRLENEENTTTLGGIRVEVMDRTETETQLKFTMRISQSERMNDGTFETTVAEQTLEFAKDAGLQSMHSLDAKAEAIAFVEAARTIHAQADATDVTFHNLQETSGVMEPPKAVRERAGCGGFAVCEIPVRFIEFDIVNWYENGESSRVSIDWAFSAKTPWLPYGNATEFTFLSGFMITDCASTYIPIEGRTVYLRQCKNLEDFQK